MQVEAIRLKNFKCFRNLELKEIPRFCVLVGANGTGKSTLFQVFGFLREAFVSNIHTAFQKVSGSRAMGKVMDPERNRSCSFKCFINGMKRMVSL
ncbi:MAG: AAA family ATPase [Magnetococcales bacterium]|nr:AAA family ATPase [Magnetococcales bacterium]